MIIPPGSSPSSSEGGCGGRVLHPSAISLCPDVHKALVRARTRLMTAIKMRIASDQRGPRLRLGHPFCRPSIFLLRRRRRRRIALDFCLRHSSAAAQSRVYPLGFFPPPLPAISRLSRLSVARLHYRRGPGRRFLLRSLRRWRFLRATKLLYYTPVSLWTTRPTLRRSRVDDYPPRPCYPRQTKLIGRRQSFLSRVPRHLGVTWRSLEDHSKTRVLFLK